MKTESRTLPILSLGGLVFASGLLLAWRTCALRIAPDGPALSNGGFDYITEKCATLSFRPDRVIAFAATLENEEYDGSLRGALGTLWSGSGNSLDRAHLLMEMLRRCGVEARIAEHETFGVERRSGTDWVWVGESKAPRRRAFVEIPDDVKHVLTIDGHPFWTASLIGTSVTLAYEGDAVVLRVGRDRFARPFDPRAERLDLVLEHRAPDGTKCQVKRELWTREFVGKFPCLFDSKNRYEILVTAGFVGEEVLNKELDRHKDDFAHAAAFSFVTASDRNTRRLRREIGVRAWFATPRLTIAATEYDGPHRVATLDLRKNDIVVSGDEEKIVSFNLLRSLHDQSLEAEILRQATGQAAFGALELLAACRQETPISVSARRKLLYDNLTRLFKEGRPGWRVRFSPAGLSSTLRAEFLRASDGSLSAAFSPPACLSDSFRAKMGRLVDADLESILNETEACFALTGNLPMDYSLEMEFSDSTGDLLLQNARIFETDTRGRTTFEYQFVQTEPDVVLDGIDYYDTVNKKFFDSPGRTRLTIARDDLRDCSVYTNWMFFGEDANRGRVFNMLSRKMYQDLVERGRTTVTVRIWDKSETERMIWFLCERRPVDIRINNRKTTVTALVVGGDYERNAPTKKAQQDYPDIKDEHGLLLNKFVFLDDARLTVELSNVYDRNLDWYRIQTAMASQVFDADTARGVAGAEVRILGTSSRAVTWGDGRASLPLMEQPFGEFEVEVSAPGFQAFKAKIDFRKPEALPLHLEIKAIPGKLDWIWIDRSTLPDLGRLKISDRAKALIREVLAGRESVGVLIPQREIHYDYGTLNAWLEVDTRTHAVYARSEDGLYGSTIRDYATPDPYWAPRAGVAYLHGRVAAWWAWSTGALSAVGLAIETGRADLDEMYKHACKVTDEIVATYESFLFGAANGFGSNPPLLMSYVLKKTFQKGLHDGTALAKKFYKEAWGVR